MRPSKHLAGSFVLLLVALPALLAQGTAPGGSANALIEQRRAGVANWQRAFDKGEPPHHETANLLLYGTAPGKNLKEVGTLLEKDFAAAKKALALGKNDLWPGKLTVYLVADRAAYAAFIRRIEKRYPEEGEAGSASVRRDQPHVVAGPPQGPLDPPVEGQAGAQVGVALLKKKAGEGVPEWVRAGFGRATYLQTAPARERAAERRLVLSQVVQKGRAVQDAWGALDDPAAPALRASVIEYLAYSGRTKRFVPFVLGFRPEEGKQEPTTADALKAAEIAPAQLNQLWQRWLRAGR
jgi:hypothetical protein